jgi:hypothetical protein
MGRRSTGSKDITARKRSRVVISTIGLGHGPFHSVEFPRDYSKRPRKPIRRGFCAGVLIEIVYRMDLPLPHACL